MKYGTQLCKEGIHTMLKDSKVCLMCGHAVPSKIPPKSLDTPTIDELVDWILHEPSYTPHQMKEKILQWHKDKARSYVPEKVKLPKKPSVLYTSTEITKVNGYNLAIDQTLKSIEESK